MIGRPYNFTLIVEHTDLAISVETVLAVRTRDGGLLVLSHTTFVGHLLMRCHELFGPVLGRPRHLLLTA